LYGLVDKNNKFNGINNKKLTHIQSECIENELEFNAHMIQCSDGVTIRGIYFKQSKKQESNEFEAFEFAAASAIIQPFDDNNLTIRSMSRWKQEFRLCKAMNLSVSLDTESSIYAFVWQEIEPKSTSVEHVFIPVRNAATQEFKRAACVCMYQTDKASFAQYNVNEMCPTMETTVVSVSDVLKSISTNTTAIHESYEDAYSVLSKITNSTVSLVFTANINIVIDNEPHMFIIVKVAKQEVKQQEDQTLNDSLVLVVLDLKGKKSLAMNMAVDKIYHKISNEKPNSTIHFKFDGFEDERELDRIMLQLK